MNPIKSKFQRCIGNINPSAESHGAAVQRWRSLQDGASIILGFSGLCLVVLYRLSLLHLDIIFLGFVAGILIALAYLFVYLKMMTAALFASLLTAAVLAYTAVLSVGLYFLIANGGLGVGLSLGVVALITKVFSMGK